MKNISTELKVKVVTLRNGKEGRELIADWRDKFTIIEKGFRFDGASAPWFVWMLVPPFKDLELSCRHDFDCKTARELMARIGVDCAKVAAGFRERADRRYADGKAGRGTAKNRAIYAGLRLGSMCGSGWRSREI